MAGARNHHYVPQGYLRGFAEGIGRRAKVRVLDLADIRTFPTLVRNIAAKRDFNRVTIDGVDPNALEDSFARFEAGAIAAIHRIIKSQSFEGEDRILVLNLLAVLIIRNPRARDTWADFMGRLWRMTGEMMVSKKEIWESITKRMKCAGYEVNDEVTYEQMRDFVKSGEYDIVTDRHMHIRLELETLDSIIRVLMSRRWRLGVLPEGAPNLITCDHPVCLISTVPRPAGLMGHIGYGMKGTAVVFPVTRRLSLWGTFEDDDQVQPIGRLQAAVFNAHAVNNAERQIYSLDENFEYAWGHEIRRGSQLLHDIKQAKAAV